MQNVLDAAAMSRLVSEALGRVARVVDARRVRGGSRKGVFRLLLDDADTVILYVWRDEENWWRTVSDAEACSPDPLANNNGLPLFVAANRELTAAGISSPKVLLTRFGGDSGVDAALVEYVPRSLEDLLSEDPASATRTMQRLRELLSLMESSSHPTYGPVHSPCESPEFGFHEVVLRRALAHVDSAAVREPRIAVAADRLRQELHQRADAVGTRHRFSLVHGELGPDHVRVDAAGRPLLIDVEGLMWADLEWEHAFLELRFADHYHALRAPNLDENRMQLYRLATHISLVEGPLRLLETNFPHREGFRDIVESNIARTLASVA